jgi:ADP-heptose:LPS heptosyltransferase
MSDPLLKRIELIFRHRLMRILGIFVHRKYLPQDKVNYNSCKLLCIRQDRIGDVLISTPIFASIKRHYPDAILDVLLSANNYFVLENDPLIHKRWIYYKSISKIIRLIKEIRREKYDYVIDMMDNPSVTATLLCIFAGGRVNVGLLKDNNYAYDIAVPMLSRKDTHIVDRISQLLTAFEIDPNSEELKVRYFISNESDKFIDKFLVDNKLTNKNLVGINISAGGTARFWGIENYRRLLCSIIEKHPELAAIVLFKPTDIEKAKMIVKSIDNALLSPLTETFDQFAALIKRISLLVSPDTSAIHLASAFGIPSVVLYVQTSKSLRIWEPYNVDYETLVTDSDDLSSIPFQAVLSAFERMLNRIQLH